MVEHKPCYYFLRRVWLLMLYNSEEGTSPVVSLLMTLALIGIFTHYASTCNSIKKKKQGMTKDDSEEGPRLQHYTGEVPEKIVLAPAGDSLLENKPT
ncbi:hypothetical protein GCK32_012932 [Trichostrongylus colubriformis]|uniref:Uncharacterized protein n=1 Tax=Trichostrongylus colubriformis TaxID=6319 RepID=A0AAN8IKU1_TRICO